MNMNIVHTVGSEILCGKLTILTPPRNVRAFLRWFLISLQVSSCTMC